MVTSYRSRYRTVIVPEIRQLRLALGLTVEESASLLGESPDLLQDQEQGGSRADRSFASECARRYLAHAAKLAQTRDFPPMTDSTGTSTVYRLRMGLHLNPRDSIAILRQPYEWISAVEDGRHPLPDEVRRRAWGGYADWAYRSWRRWDRHSAALQRDVTQPKKVKRTRQDFSPREVATLQRLAYAPQMSAEQAEAKARKLLGLN